MLSKLRKMSEKSSKGLNLRNMVFLLEGCRSGGPIGRPALSQSSDKTVPGACQGAAGPACRGVPVQEPEVVVAEET